MTDKGMIFNGDMVSAILAGTKTQTRRIIKSPKWSKPEMAGVDFPCPYPVGSRIWVRETWAKFDDLFIYRATASDFEKSIVTKWLPSIFMPREAYRICLIVEDVRVQRVREISEADAMAEGIEDGGCLNCGNSQLRIGGCGCDSPQQSFRDSFVSLWDSIYAKRGYGWSENPWVWAITFRREA